MYLNSSSRNWQKIQVIGYGSHQGTVIYLALSLYPYRSSKLIAVKSTMIENSSSLQKEDRVLQQFSNCPEIVHCYGNELSIENHQHRIYNLLLEYAEGGNLLDLIHSDGGSLPEVKVQVYTRMILKGLRRIHEKGYVHCDLNPTSILVFVSQNHAGVQLKIASFGSAKEPGKEVSNELGFRGNPLYMSPESVAFGEVETPLDIWSLGCIVMGMIGGKLPWSCLKESELVHWLALSNEEPELPQNMSAKGKDFLEKCFVRNPGKRWTAKMLLKHPFVAKCPQNLDAMPCS